MISLVLCSPLPLEAVKMFKILTLRVVYLLEKCIFFVTFKVNQFPILFNMTGGKKIMKKL